MQNDDLTQALSSGLTYAEIGKRFGISRQRVHQLAKRLGLDGRPRVKTVSARDKEVAAAIAGGATQLAVAQTLGITRQRVQQITSKAGVRRPRSEPRVRRVALKKDMAAVRAEWAAKHFDVPLDVYMEMRASGAVTAYTRHRASAGERGIAWEFSLASWWRVWVESGRWGQRGTRTGMYVMARWGDEGPYAPSNVRITTNRVNLQEAAAIRLQKTGVHFIIR